MPSQGRNGRQDNSRTSLVEQELLPGLTFRDVDEWRPLPRPRLEGRIEHTVVWTGREVIVWGGEACNDGCYQSDGAAYVPPGAMRSQR
jgi:hypothetical protein